MKLLTRDRFREKVLERDNYICVVPSCDRDAVDAHHILERRLWKNGGYYIENGASLCEIHHKMAEHNQIVPQLLRQWCDISEIILPDQLAPAKDYDKWGNILEKPKRMIFKYPTTFYMPFSPIPSKHKRDVGKIEDLLGAPLVITIKMDGSNVKLNSQRVAARNAKSADHKSFDMLKAKYACVRRDLPEHLDFFGEWIYAKHSIHYVGDLALDDFLQLFAVYDQENNLWLSWDDVEYYAEKVIRCHTTPVLTTYDRIDKAWEFENEIIKIATRVIESGHEGMVARNRFGFHYSQFNDFVLKFVREGHVQTDKHWKTQRIIRNELKEGSEFSY